MEIAASGLRIKEQLLEKGTWLSQIALSVLKALEIILLGESFFR